MWMNEWLHWRVCESSQVCVQTMPFHFSLWFHLLLLFSLTMILYFLFFITPHSYSYFVLTMLFFFWFFLCYQFMWESSWLLGSEWVDIGKVCCFEPKFQKGCFSLRYGTSLWFLFSNFVVTILSNCLALTWPDTDLVSYWSGGLVGENEIVGIWVCVGCCICTSGLWGCWDLHSNCWRWAYHKLHWRYWWVWSYCSGIWWEDWFRKVLVYIPLYSFLLSLLRDFHLTCFSLH